MVVTAWTGVASAPFGSATLCSLLKIDCGAMAESKPITEEKLNIWRAAFADAACDPAALLVLAIDETSFLVPEALHHVDMQLRRLRGLPEVPFGGVALLLTTQSYPSRHGRQRARKAEHNTALTPPFSGGST